MKLGVLILHGIGNHTPAFADGMVQELRERIGVSASKDVYFKPCFWGGVLDKRERLLAKTMEPHTDKHRIRRELVLGGFGDLIAYNGPPNQKSHYYNPIHREVNTALVQMETKVLREGGDPTRVPVLVMAHSLGCYVASNYIWDHQQRNQHAFGNASPFSRLETLCGLITFGCNGLV